ncbi:major facilitator superfamily domain-containing protein [Thermoascus aurantiacus ATCC 26904]
MGSLVRRLDLVLMPTLALVYLTHTLDRANLGNAKSGNLEKDLGLKGNQYSLVLMLFYIPYAIFNIPATILAKRFNPAMVIPLLVLGWGGLAMLTAAVENFHGLMTCRIIMGMMEAGFMPCSTFYCSMFYTRKELALRLSMFFCMGFIAGAISGLISFSVFQWHKALKGWQYLFLIEGSLTVEIALWALLWLPRSVQASHLKVKKSEFFSWVEGIHVLKDWKVWTFAFSALLYGVGVASSSNFLPVMIKRLTDDTVQASLYTIGPNLTAVVIQLTTCYLSDRMQQRAWFSMGSILVSMIGWILLGSLDLVNHLTYLLTFGTFTPALLIPAWVGVNTPSASGRAVALGLVSMFQNLGGIISSAVYRAQDAPVYRPALITVSDFQGVFIVICLGQLP